MLATSTPRDGLGRVSAGRRIAILGDMLELGPEEAALHTVLATRPAMEAISRVHCVGPRARDIWQALPRGKRGQPCQRLSPHQSPARKDQVCPQKSEEDPRVWPRQKGKSGYDRHGKVAGACVGQRSSEEQCYGEVGLHSSDGECHAVWGQGPQQGGCEGGDGVASQPLC